MEEKRLSDTLKATAEPSKGKINVARKFATALTALSMSVFVALGTAACGGKEQEPETPSNPNPPVVSPVDPDPVEQEPENPSPEKPDPENPDDTNPETPEDPDDGQDDNSENPDESEIDYDNLTAADLTEEQKAKIVENVTTALKDNIQKEIGRAGYLNKVIAMDFEGNCVTLFLDYNGVNGDTYGLYKYKMTSEMSYKNLLTTNIEPQTHNMAGETLIQFSANSDDDRAEQVLQKLLNDNCISTTQHSPDIIYIAKGGSSTDSILKCGITTARLYRLSSDLITSVTLSVKSDGSTKDFILDHLINGTKNVSYRAQESVGYEYNFSQNALYEFNGLQNANSAEQEN